MQPGVVRGGRIAEPGPTQSRSSLLSVGFPAARLRLDASPAAPASRAVSVVLDDIPGNHAAVYHTFNEAIWEGRTTFNTDGIQGRMELELANAMIYSNYTRSAVDLPLDRQSYVALLQDLQEQKRS